MENSSENTSRIDVLLQEIRERQQEILKLNREAGGPVRDYSLVGAGNVPVNLSDLFGTKKDLIVVHNMGRRCSYCTLWADGFNGLYQHLADRAGFVVVSPDTPEVQQEFAAGRGWTFPMYSDQETSFTRDLGFIGQHEGKDFWWPGYSTFRRNDDGTIERIGRDFFGPGDQYCGIWHMFDLLADGAAEWQPSFTYEHAAI